MAFDLSRWTSKITSDAYELFFDSLPAPNEPWREFCEIEEDTSRILVQTDSLAYAGELEIWEEGDSLVYETPKDGYTVYGRVRFFRKGRKISWHQKQVKDMEAELMRQIKNWAEALAYTRNKWIKTMLEEGAKTAGHSVFNQSISASSGAAWTDPTGNFIYDNKPFFGDDQRNAGGCDYRHPVKADPSILLRNYQALPLNYDNLVAVYNEMKQNGIDDYGRKISIRPNILLVPPALEITARQLVEADYMPHDSTTPSKPNPFKGVLNVLVWDELEDQDAWYLIDSRMKGIVVFDNPEDVDINVWVDPDTREVRCDITAKFGAYVRNWRPFYACNLAQS